MEYNQGHKAFYSALRLEDNPYLPNTYKFVDWRAGYLDAKHRQEGKNASETITLINNMNFKGP